MNVEMILLKEIRNEITRQPDAGLAFKNILGLAKEKFQSSVWEQFSGEYFDNDIAGATKWIQETIDHAQGAKGIYLGLDTLNMDNGDGFNVEIGINSACDSDALSYKWAFSCDYYGAKHLIHGLYLLFDNFVGSEEDERDLAEYVVFLSYSGLVLREALLKIKMESDFISCWGFHDGDIFLLMNKTGNKRIVLANRKTSSRHS